jgi:hypothetical protein
MQTCLVAYFPPQPGLKPHVESRLRAEYGALLRRMYPALAVRVIVARGEPYILTARGERFATHVPPPVIEREGFDSRRWLLVWPLVGLALWAWVWPL